MNYIAQSVENLQLYLLMVPPDFNLEVLNLEKLQQGFCENIQVQVEAWIIGESHCWKITHPDWDFALIEVFACYELDLENLFKDSVHVEVLLRKSLSELRDHNFYKNPIFLEAERFKYRFGLKELPFVNFDKSCPNRMNAALSLSYKFPDCEGVTPFTKFNIRNGTDKFVISSRHDYPNENKLILTTGILSF